MYTQSKINYGDFDLTITQSGTTTISAQGLANLFTDDNTSYEEIPGKFVTASGGLSAQGNTSWTGGTVSTNNNVLGGSPYTYYGPNYTEHLIGIDCGTAKYADTFTLSATDVYTFMGSASTAKSGSAAFQVFGSNNNSTWTSLGTINNSVSLGYGCLYGSFTRASYRYFVILRRDIGVQPVGTSHINDQLPIRTNAVWFFDSQNTSTYEMVIDLGKNVKVDELIIEQDNPKREMLSPLTVTYSLDNVSYSATSPVYRAGFYPEPKASEASPAATTTGYTDSTYMGRFMVYSPIDNSLYVRLSDKFVIFSLDTKTWSSSPTDILSSLQSGGAIDTIENVIYGVNAAGVFWKYTIESQEFCYLSSPPTKFSGVGSTIAYSSTDKALYCLIGNQTNTFYKYDTETDTWTQKANFPLTGTSGIWTGSTSVWSPYDNCVYVTYEQFNVRMAKYNCSTNTWSTTNSTPYTDAAVAGNYNRSNVGMVLDTKRNFIYLLGTGFRAGNCFYAIESGSWIGIPMAGIAGSGMWTHLYSRANVTSDSTRSAFSGHCGIAYVPAEDKLYVHGDTLSDVSVSGRKNRQFANILRKTGPLEEAKYVRYFIGRNTRYIKITPSSNPRSSLIRLKKLKITTYDQEQTTTNLGIPQIGVAGEPQEFSVSNPLLVSSSAGRAYIRPDGSQGSRYYEIGATTSGTYYPHCTHNDLENFQCLASNSNYNTTLCSRKCTLTNGGGSATGGYTQNFLDLTFSPALAPGENANIFIRENIPSSKRPIERALDVVVEFDGEE